MRKAYYDLRLVKAAIAAGNAFLVRRDKNLAALETLGFAESDAMEEIMSLTVNHFKGIAWERGRAADEYVKLVEGREVYIKFFMENDLVVLSFHL